MTDKHFKPTFIFRLFIIKHDNFIMIPSPLFRLADGSESSSTAYLAHSGPFVVGGGHGQQRLHQHQQRWVSRGFVYSSIIEMFVQVPAEC